MSNVFLKALSTSALAGLLFTSPSFSFGFGDLTNAINGATQAKNGADKAVNAKANVDKYNKKLDTLNLKIDEFTAKQKAALENAVNLDSKIKLYNDALEQFKAQATAQVAAAKGKAENAKNAGAKAASKAADKAKNDAQTQANALIKLADGTELTKAALEEKLNAENAAKALVQAEIDSYKAKLDNSLAEKERIKKIIANGGIDPDAKYGVEGLPGSATSKAKASFEAPSPKAFELPKGKIALVRFSLNRQIVLEADKDNKEAQVRPGLMNDTTKFWAPYNAGMERLWKAFASQKSDLFGELMNNETFANNPVYLKHGDNKPMRIMGMSIPTDEMLAPLTGNFSAYSSDKMKAVAEAIGADYLLFLEYKAHYACYDGNISSAEAALKLSLTLKITDKQGKVVVERNLAALSDHKGQLVDNEIYPNAITWLPEEAQAKILTQLKSLIQK